MSNETEGCARLESEAQIVDGKLVISLRIGTLWESLAIPELRGQAAHAAQALLDELR